MLYVPRLKAFAQPETLVVAPVFAVAGKPAGAALCAPDGPTC